MGGANRQGGSEDCCTAMLSGVARDLYRRAHEAPWSCRRSASILVTLQEVYAG